MRTVTVGHPDCCCTFAFQPRRTKLGSRLTAFPVSCFPVALRCVVWFRFDGDFHLSTLLEADPVSVLVHQSVFDAKLSVEVIGPFHGDLGLFRFTWVYRFNDFFDNCRQSGAWFFAHHWLLTSTVSSEIGGLQSLRHVPRNSHYPPALPNLFAFWRGIAVLPDPRRLVFVAEIQSKAWGRLRTADFDRNFRARSVLAEKRIDRLQQNRLPPRGHLGNLRIQPGLPTKVERLSIQTV